MTSDPEEREWLSETDLRFGQSLMRFDPTADESMHLLAAAVCRSVRAGHVCFTEELAPLAMRASIRAAIYHRGTPLLGDGNSVTPLVADGSGRVYLHRYYQRERRVAEALHTRATVAPNLIEPSTLNVVDRLFGSDPGDESRLAAIRALESNLLVITGGPGSGKTTTVLRLLALLAEDAQRRGSRSLHYELLAPTGKAAARLGEAIRVGIAALDTTYELKAAIPTEAKTIHRALDWSARGGPRFDARRPWTADLVVVDETSMVDLELMHCILEATRRRARLVLLGDPNQLASVEAGSVLADLAHGADRFRPSTVRRLQDYGVASMRAEPSATPIDDTVVNLKRSHRYAQSSGIAQLARAVLDGDAKAAGAVLEDPDIDDVEIRPARRNELIGAARDLHLRVCSLVDPKQRLETLKDSKVICARRSGSLGLESINRDVRRRIGAPALGAFDGQPMLVRKNDPRVDLYNGDLGVVDKEAAKVWFPSTGGSLHAVALALVPPHDDAFAMSVHQSQGSEFDHVSVVLASEDSNLARREVVFTAITRARRRVVIYGTLDELRAAVEQRVVRVSGLLDRLIEAQRGLN